MRKSIQVAVIGAGPAGIYAADILVKSDLGFSVDIFERLPAPFGLVRYGVAPDHPRIKQIIVALYKILQRGDIQFYGNVEVGLDVTMEELKDHYDAVIVATGADRDAKLDIPGVDLPQCYGAADFVSWYDGHPDYPRDWPLDAKEVAVVGAGNVALDVARILAKNLPEMLTTEIPQNVVDGLAQNLATDVHIFGRRGPAQVKFTPLELRELAKCADVDVVVSEEDFDFDAGSNKAMKQSNQQRQVVKVLTSYASQDPRDQKAAHRIHIHMFEAPSEIVADGNGDVVFLRTERTELVGDGSVRGTGIFKDWPVDAVYRAVGYFSSPLSGVPFDGERGIVPNRGGRVLDGPDGSHMTGMYVTGWIKRGPVGLIGSTKSDAQETVANLVEDVRSGAIHVAPRVSIVELLMARGVPFTTWGGWEILDSFEQNLGAQFGELSTGGFRERIKVVSREMMTQISRGENCSEKGEHDLVGQPGELGVPTAMQRFPDFTGPNGFYSSALGTVFE